MAYIDEVIADGPLAYLRLNESSGTVAADSSGNGNVGTYVGAVSLGVPGLIATDTDTAAQITGNHQITLPYGLPTNTFTIEMWWKYTAPGTPGGILRDHTAAGGTGYSFSAISTGFNVRIAGVDRLVSTTDYRDNIRHHFVLTYDGSTAAFFIDGAQVDTWSRVSATLPATPLHIGYNGTNSGQYQPGVYDEFALYNYVLSPARVAQHYSVAGVNPAQAQIETIALETMVITSSNAQVESLALETMVTTAKNAQVEAVALEVMAPVQPVVVSSVYNEAVLGGTPDVRVGSVYLEGVLTTNPPVQVSSVYVETVLLGAPSQSFAGWGSPITA